MASKYDVSYERDEGGWWIARVEGVQGVHSNGRTIADARRRVREALALAVGDEEAEAAELKDDVKLPPKVREQLKTYRRVRKEAAQAQDRVLGVSHEVIGQLTEQLGMSVRDAAELLGLSHQRVQQIKVKRPIPSATPARATRVVAVRERRK